MAEFPAENWALKEPLITRKSRHGETKEDRGVKETVHSSVQRTHNSTKSSGKLTDDSLSSKSSESQVDGDSQNTIIIGVTTNETTVDGSNSCSANLNKWKEAALYVDEGEKDAKIFHHPTGYWSKRAFKTLHHPAYYVIHLTVSILLMLLAVAETPIFLQGQHPAHQTNKLLLSLHTVVEIVFLAFFCIDILLRFVWFGPKRFFTHFRTVFISIVLFVMIIEALTVLIRQDSHLRLTRALRPVLFIDSHYLFGVRRVMRQIFLCIKPITDVLLLILFFIVFFSLLGYYIFSEVDPTFFASFWRSFVSLFITMTTANNPDVMLEAFFEHNFSPIFFVAYLAITFYFLMNVLLAVVYGSFEEQEKKKFKKLFIHKLGALDKAYEVLTTENAGVCFYDFLVFMQYYRPLTHITTFWSINVCLFIQLSGQVMCTFKALHNDPQKQQQHLSKEEFRRLYEMRNLNWKADRENKLAPRYQLTCLVKIHRFFVFIVKSKAFNISVNLVVLVNLFFLIIYTIITSGSAIDRYIKLRKVLPVSYTFICVYIVEIIMRIIGSGPFAYFRKSRNIADFIIILISFICLILETEVPKLIFLAAVRPFKLIRVLRLKRRFRDISSTTLALLPRLTNIAVLLIVVYYFFAIIGIECLNGAVYRGCCNNSWFGVGSSYSGIYGENTTDNIPPSSDVYYILNFNNILTSYVTLFVLMVVNNWYIIMEGFASGYPVTSWLVRIYFMSFFIVMLVILQVVISFIVDEFKFKVLDTAKERICPVHDKPFEHCRCKRYRKKVVEVTLQPTDIEDFETARPPRKRKTVSHYVRKFRQIKLHSDCQMKFIGRRHNTKDDVKLKIFNAEIKEWTREYEVMKEKVKTKTKTEDKKSRMFEKVKNLARQCFLYFIDLVIE